MNQLNNKCSHNKTFTIDTIHTNLLKTHQPQKQQQQKKTKTKQPAAFTQ